MELIPANLLIKGVNIAISEKKEKIKAFFRSENSSHLFTLLNISIIDIAFSIVSPRYRYTLLLNSQIVNGTFSEMLNHLTNHGKNRKMPLIPH
jgi:hypothetical protein